MPNIVVAGSGRSGTTWVLDLLAQANNLRTVFEPLKECVGEVSQAFQNRYVPPDQECPQLEDFFDRVFGGELNSVWSDYRVVPERLVPSLASVSSRVEFKALVSRYRKVWRNYGQMRKKGYQGVAVKLIRANLMLDWLVHRYGVPVMRVVRHPCAVIESKMRLDARAAAARLAHGQADWHPYGILRRYLADPSFCERYAGRGWLNIDVENLTEIEAHATLWCIENMHILETWDDSAYCTAFYEDLLTGGVDTWNRVVEQLGLAGKIDLSQINKPSREASADFHQIESRREAASRWCERMSETDKGAVENVLRSFAIRQYSASNPLPLAAGA